MLNNFFSYIGVDAISSDVAKHSDIVDPNTCVYCCVATTGISSILATDVIYRHVLITVSMLYMSGRNLSCTSHNNNTVRSGRSLPIAFRPTVEVTDAMMPVPVGVSSLEFPVVVVVVVISEKDTALDGMLVNTKIRKRKNVVLLQWAEGPRTMQDLYDGTLTERERNRSDTVMVGKDFPPQTYCIYTQLYTSSTVVKGVVPS
eukprot:Pompholyxophrys_punicea_v1_NODE_162_length_3055_cov_4.636000.p3 type:complete len:202 gc:universal NODE_162_length_3055_cov_4.636000:1201-596(-)